MTDKQAIQKLLDDHKLELKFDFVAHSKSRAKDQEPNLNWNVTLLRDGKTVLFTPYSAGRGHCPSYAQNDRSIYAYNQVKTECEKGYKCATNSEFTVDRSTPITPDPLDVMNSLLIDAQVLDAASFEDWASDMGMNPDSRKDETIYRDCLQIALKLKHGLGWELIGLLNQAFEQY